MGKLSEASKSLKVRHQTLWEMAVFYLLGGIVTVVDLGVFALCNYLIFAKFKGTDFQWWLFNYGTESGGLCAMLSMACSFAVSQTVNFFLQRKVTFSATNNIVYSAAMYALMVIGTYFVILWLPTLFSAAICRLLGNNLGALVVKLITQFVSAVIQFPINKWVIMRK